MFHESTLPVPHTQLCQVLIVYPNCLGNYLERRSRQPVSSTGSEQKHSFSAMMLPPHTSNSYHQMVVTIFGGLQMTPKFDTCI